jgi:hypothetical protein
MAPGPGGFRRVLVTPRLASDTQRLKLINLPQGNADPHAPGVVVWAGRKAEDPRPSSPPARR